MVVQPCMAAPSACVRYLTLSSSSRPSSGAAPGGIRTRSASLVWSMLRVVSVREMESAPITRTPLQPLACSWSLILSSLFIGIALLWSPATKGRSFTVLSKNEGVTHGSGGGASRKPSRHPEMMRRSRDCGTP